MEITDSTSLIPLGETKIVTKAIVNDYPPSSPKAVNETEPEASVSTANIEPDREDDNAVKSIKSTGAIKKSYPSESIDEERPKEKNFRRSWRESWLRDLKLKLEKEEDEAINLVKSEVATPEEKAGSKVVIENIEMKKLPSRNKNREDEITNDADDIIEEVTLPQHSEYTIDYSSRESLLASGFVVFVNTSFIGFVIYVIIAYFQFTNKD